MMNYSSTFQRLGHSARTLEYHCRGFRKVRGGRVLVVRGRRARGRGEVLSVLHCRYGHRETPFGEKWDVRSVSLTIKWFPRPY
jgi:hypothetical protein